MLRLPLASYLRESMLSLESVDSQSLNDLRDDIYQAYESGNTVFFCGNGGSGASASHLVQDFGKSLVPENRREDSRQKRLRILCLNESASKPTRQKMLIPESLEISHFYYYPYRF